MARPGVWRGLLTCSVRPLTRVCFPYARAGCSCPGPGSEPRLLSVMCLGTLPTTVSAGGLHPGTCPCSLPPACAQVQGASSNETSAGCLSGIGSFQV